MSFSKNPSQKQQDDVISQKSNSAFGHRKLSQYTVNTKNDKSEYSRFTKIDENESEYQEDRADEE